MGNSKEPYGEIFKYLLETNGMDFKTNCKKGEKPIPGLSYSATALKDIKYGKKMSERAALEIANLFSEKLKHPEERAILPADLTIPIEKFKILFPRSAFKHTTEEEVRINTHLYINKLFRGYYMAPDAPNTVFMAYLMLYERQGIYSAYMVRGIQDFLDLKGIDFIMRKEPEKLADHIAHINDGSNKRVGSIHVLKAENDYSGGRQNIVFTKNNIRIDFHSIEKDPCFCTLFWNTKTANKLHINSYIGGTCMMVDTNDGRKKNICATKIGLEALDNIPNDQKEHIDKAPLLKTSARVISEISLDSVDGIFKLDDSDDNRFYHFIQSDAYRGYSDNRFTDIDVENLVDNLNTLKAAYEKSLSDLKTYVDMLKKE